MTPLSFLQLVTASTPLSPTLAAQTGPLTAWSILTATAGLIAFHVGLFTLVGRERKSPYLINQVFPIFLYCLLIAAVTTSSTLLPTPWSEWTLIGSAALLVSAFVWSAWKAFGIAIRFFYFVDTIRPTDLPGLRWLGRRRRNAKRGVTYSHDPNPIPAELQARIVEILSKSANGRLATRDSLGNTSVAVATMHQGQANELLAELAEAFLNRNFTVQYLTASRHPIEFLTFLSTHLGDAGNAFKKRRKSIVVIDAYSPHFAFLDSIYRRKDEEVQKLDVTSIRSRTTFAGMHSASSKAFKTIRDQTTSEDRDPTLVIYEDSYALSDLESAEQYRIFVRHVMPSERMWGSMFTVFVESAQPDTDWKVLQSYASMTLDFRDKGTVTPSGSAAVL